jgi:hypothetical protein
LWERPKVPEENEANFALRMRAVLRSYSEEVTVHQALMEK